MRIVSRFLLAMVNHGAGPARHGRRSLQHPVSGLLRRRRPPGPHPGGGRPALPHQERRRSAGAGPALRPGLFGARGPVPPLGPVPPARGRRDDRSHPVDCAQQSWQPDHRQYRGDAPLLLCQQQYPGLHLPHRHGGVGFPDPPGEVSGNREEGEPGLAHPQILAGQVRHGGNAAGG